MVQISGEAKNDVRLRLKDENINATGVDPEAGLVTIYSDIVDVDQYTYSAGYESIMISKPEPGAAEDVEITGSSEDDGIYDVSIGQKVPDCEHEYETELVEPTCTHDGCTIYTCVKCGDVYQEDGAPALGHDWDGGTVTVQPTETEPGERTYTCTRCGETKTESIPAGTAADQCGDNLYWSFDEDTGKLTITGSGEMWDYQFDNTAPWYSLREKIQTVSLPAGLTKIGANAFGTVYAIDPYFPDGYTNLRSVTIPDSVTTICPYAFAGCSGLTSITIPKNVLDIQWGVFRECSSLTSINVSSDNPNYCSINGVLFDKNKTKLIQYPGGKTGAYQIPNGVVSIYDESFFGCHNLTSISIPDSVIEIERNAFMNCTSLSSVTIPNSVEHIGDMAFEGCQSLATIVLSDSLLSIGEAAFYYTAFYNNPENWTGDLLYLENWLLKAKDSIKNAEIRPGTKHIAIEAFRGCFDLGNVEIPDGVATIGNQAFCNCSSLARISIPDSVTYIGNYAFGDTAYSNNAENWSGELLYLGNWLIAAKSSITEVEIPSGTIGIASDAFSDYREDPIMPESGGPSFCLDLTGVTIPESVKYICDYAFVLCSSLTDLTILNPSCTISDEEASGATLGDPAVTTIYGYSGSTAETYANQYGYTFKVLGGEPVDPGETTSGTCGDNLSWSFDKDTGVLTVTGSGAMEDYFHAEEQPPWHDFAPAISEVILPDGLTRIGQCAFLGCANLTSVEIPDSVTEIGDAAFDGCTNLQRLTIPGNVEQIDAIAFQACWGIQEIRVAEENKAFCSEEGVLFNKSKTELIYCPPAKTGTYQIPDGVTIIGEYAFNNCSSLTSVTIPDSVTSIGNSAFQGCGDLTDIALPDGLAQLGFGAFYGCNGLKTVTIPDSLTSIEDGVFGWCEGLEHMTVPATVTSIGTYAFNGCGRLEKLEILNPTCRIAEESWDGLDLGDPAVTVIYGYPGSTAEDFANENGYRFEALDAEQPVFVDVPEKAFYAQPVAWAVEQGVTNGIDPTHFGPDRGCTRGQVVTFLWRAAGCPEPENRNNPFKDVKDGAFYYTAVLWAVEAGVTNGTSPTTFSPDATCTRGQIVTFLWRANGSSRVVTVDSPFTDVTKTAFYYPAMLWAVENGITTGTSPTTFAPNATCTRGQVVTFLFRTAQKSDETEFEAENYELVISDCSWSDALADAKAKGGRLVNLDSYEEYRFVLELIEAQGYEHVFFSLGGRRDDGGKVYYWVDGNDNFCSEPLNEDGAWCSACWEPGDPNFEYQGRPETTVILYYRERDFRWAWYDGSATYHTPGRVYGYIIEYGQDSEGR